MTATLSAAQAAALSRLRADWERVQTATKGTAYAEACSELQAAKKALGEVRWTLIAMVAVHGRTVASIARTANKSDEEMTRVFLAAVDALAIHYERTA